MFLVTVVDTFLISQNTLAHTLVSTFLMVSEINLSQSKRRFNIINEQEFISIIPLQRRIFI